jgi:hypothetical protein
MSEVTFDEFKLYFEFALEVLGLSSSIGVILYRVGAVHAVWRVARGRADSADEIYTLEAIHNSGAVADMVVRQVAHVVQPYYPDAATRLEGLQSQSRAASPGQMV